MQMDEAVAAGLVAGRSGRRPGDGRGGTDRAKVLEAMPDRLPAGRERRMALLLSAMEDLSTAEIGAVLGKSGVERRLRSLLFRARDAA